MLAQLKHHYQAGKAAMQSGDFQVARFHFETLIQLDPSITAAHFNAGSCALKLQDFESASFHYQNALNLEADAETHFNLGWLGAKRGQYEWARRHYESALQLNPRHFESHFNLGLLAAESGVTELGIFHLKVALSLQASEQVQYHLDRLEGKARRSIPEEHVRDLFDQYADHFDHHLLELQYRVPQEIGRMLTEGLNSSALKSMSVLDLGCGTGLIGEILKGDVACMQGVDISPSMIQKAKEKGVYQSLEVAEIFEYLSRNSLKQDLIIAADVLVYFGDLDPLFNLLKTQMKPNSDFIFSVENETDGGEKYRFQSSGRFTHNHKYVKSIVTEGLGFEIVKENVIKGRVQNKTAVNTELWWVRKR